MRWLSVWLLASSMLACVHNDKVEFRDGNALLYKAKTYSEKSRQAILEANTKRKQLKSLHKERRQSKASKDNMALQRRIKAKNRLITDLQQDGAQYRKKSSSYMNQASETFALAMSDRWQDWIKHRGPLSSEKLDPSFLAHNTPLLSVHPRLLRQRGHPEKLVSETKTKEMTLDIDALKGQNAPKNLDINSFQISKDKALVAHIEVLSDENSDPALVPINEMHKWVLVVSDTEGRPFVGDIEVDGHMPGHVHGLPTKPRVTKSLAPGVFQIEGMKFQMPGWWVMTMIARNDKAEDSINFNLIL
ncbi:MAG: FixH family protein [Pseudobacteriovorax sp.]|nr:FixH family protein [Pseudobacteriovorax sp.]